MKLIRPCQFLFVFAFLLSFSPLGAATVFDRDRHPVPHEHPRLLGSAEYLRQLARERPEAYTRMSEIVTQREGGDHERMLSCALVYAIDGPSAENWGREAVKIALKHIDDPILVGHTRFGDILANCALVYDLCWPLWTPEQRQKFHDYISRTVEANVESEPSVFHNAWYSYKHWGYGLAAYATYYEYDRAQAIHDKLENDYQEMVLPAYRMAGAGGGWAEGYYINYWSYEWMFFCECARRVEGVDYFGAAPEFLGHRAVASMFETYPGIGAYASRRPVPMGDGRGDVFTAERDKALCARRILVNRFRDDPDNQVVHAFNETTPLIGSSVNAYKDFLWRDTTVPAGDLKSFRLSHVSPGAGFVSARSSWDEDATYFFFKAGDRFTAHQHLDNGHFLIFKHEELAGDGGVYDTFEGNHAVNYYCRTIAHNTMLIKDPSEAWSNIRAWSGRMVNDGGQTHSWPHHNGSVLDSLDWAKNAALYDIADLNAFDDHGSWLYTAGDLTRSYSKKKLEQYTRQIVYLRPGTFVIFDRVRSTRPEYAKTWLLQAMTVPERRESGALVLTNGRGRLFVQSLLPQKATQKLVSGPELYVVDGWSCPPEREIGRSVQCRVEVSPPTPQKQDYFLHVLTATDSGVETVPAAMLSDGKERVTVSLEGGWSVSFEKAHDGGVIRGPQGEFPLELKVNVD
ncbi:heparinase II/III-family protein [bacterium]|nr:heparinase II/III-family protein [bacterium]